MDEQQSNSKENTMQKKENTMQNRREFLRNTMLAGAGCLAANVVAKGVPAKKPAAKAKK